jgi:DNA-binding NarL/FixJ family response regulator
MVNILKTYNIIVADDHMPFRKSLIRVIDNTENLEVIAEAGDGLELLNLLNNISPHLVILDVSMPNLNGIEAACEIQKRYPDVKILMMTIHKEREYRMQAIAAGAEGYILKENADRELFNAISTVREGGIYISPYFDES